MQTISHYRILKKLGEGGMAEVFLAEDTRLKRKVALKFLSAQLTSDESRLNRFRQEARAASSLNHPCILTVFDIGEADSAHFIATEYVEGETLRRRISRTPMDLTEALDIGIQVAGALAAAHQAGIVHRDIKPENIMVRPDGYVKLLDFGIAKLTEQRADPVDPESGRTLPVRTEPGLIMGSPRYMSPEQVRGLEVDARTDIFSLGVVLYEMAAGRPPFDGSTVSDAVVSVLHQEPPPLADKCPVAPAELQQIVAKALKKNKSERYQTAVDLLNDLKRVRQQIESQRDIATVPIRSADSSPTIAAGANPVTGAGRTGPTLRPNESPTVESSAGLGATRDALGSSSGVRSAEEQFVVTRDAAAVSPDGTDSLPSRSGKTLARHPRSFADRALRIGVWAALAVVLIAAGVLTYKRIAAGSKPKLSFQDMKISRITQTGKVIHVAVSPDGKYAEYVMNADGQQSLWVRQLATDSTVQIVPPAHVGHAGLTFSNDGNFVYYTRFTPSSLGGYASSLGALYQIATLGGSPKKLLEDIDSPVAISPDGSKLAFVRHNSQEPKSAPQEDSLMIADSDGGNIRKLLTRLWPDRIAGGGPAWLPDGSAVACSTYCMGQKYFDIVEAGVTNSAQKAVACSTKWSWVGRMSWLPDGSGPLMVATDDGGLHSQIWRVSAADGTASRITNDLADYIDLSVTADASSLVAVQTDQLSNVWVEPVGEGAQPTQITSGANNYSALAWSADGKILYASNEPGLWVMDPTGANRRRLADETGGELAVSPDGASIAFSYYHDGTQNVWLMNSGGDSPRQLTNEEGASFSPSWTKDGKTLIYQHLKRDSLVPSIMKLSLADLATTPVAEAVPGSAVVSPNAESIAYIDNDRGIVVVPLSGSEPIKQL
ncbi:MAG TPA: protein kinase, partial [Blastocatellia bacterium]